MAEPKVAKSKPRRPTGARTLYTLEVLLIGGPVSESFARENPTVSRTLQIAGDQTLEKLHHAIFGAFDRDDEHLYEFQIGGRKPHDRKARSYGHPSPGIPMFLELDSTISARRTRIDSLGLKPRNVFYYWFDFGDDWWHRVQVAAIEDAVPEGRLPRVIDRVGESPPQYPDSDEEDDFEDEEEK